MNSISVNNLKNISKMDSLHEKIKSHKQIISNVIKNHDIPGKNNLDQISKWKNLKKTVTNSSDPLKNFTKKKKLVK